MKRMLFASLSTLLLLTAVAGAQTGVVASSDVLAVKVGSSWSAGTHLTQSFDLMDLGTQKTTHIFAQAHELLAPSEGLSIYAAGATVQPDLSKLLAKTNLSPSNFQFSATGAVGNGLSSTGPNRIAWLTGASATYRLANNLQWQSLSFTYGKVGAQSFMGVSTGLSFFFGGQAQAVLPQSTAAAVKPHVSRPAMP